MVFTISRFLATLTRAFAYRAKETRSFPLASAHPPPWVFDRSRISLAELKHETLAFARFAWRRVIRNVYFVPSTTTTTNFPKCSKLVNASNCDIDKPEQLTRRTMEFQRFLGGSLDRERLAMHNFADLRLQHRWLARVGSFRLNDAERARYCIKLHLRSSKACHCDCNGNC